MRNVKPLLSNLDKLHTTEMGLERIQKNLSLEETDIILWCQNFIGNLESKITRKGKNWYIQNKNILLTVNASSYTVITAHKIKDN